MKTKVRCTLIHCEIEVEHNNKGPLTMFQMQDIINMAINKIQIKAPPGITASLGAPVCLKNITNEER